MTKIYDTHCHPHLNKIKDQEQVITDFLNNDWEYLNIIWTNKKYINKALEIANKFKNIYVTIWIHPTDTYDIDLQETIEFLENTIKNNKNKIVWIWECWLDYYWLNKETKSLSWILSPSQEKEATKIKELRKKLQKVFFKAQILLAKKYDLPLIIHNRESKEDIFSILEESWYKNFIFHCFSEDYEFAQKLLKFSPECKISFSGIVTFKNAKEIQETAKKIPLKNILAETDAPYLTPTPLRWKEENEPLYTKYVVEKISELRWKDCSEEIFENSKEVFRVK